MKNAASSSTPSETTDSQQKRKRGFFDRFSDQVARGAGKPATSVSAFILILVWGLTGPLFDYSETWQLIINTSTTIITFLMVFVIQQSQNRDNMAVQLKLNELIACNKKASNRLVDVEDLSASELDVLKKFYVKLADLAEDARELHSSHSIDEAEKVHEVKISEATQVKSTKKTGSH